MAKAYFTRTFEPTDERIYRAGTTINEIVLDYNPISKVWEVPVVCMVNQTPILRKDNGWDVALAETDVVEFVELPMGGGGGGGGSNPLKLLATLVVIIVAGWAGPVLGGLLGSKVAAAVFSGLIMMAGSLLLGAIFKAPALPSGHQGPAAAEAASPTYGLNASNNQARLYQPVGEGFGRIKIIPDRAAQAYGLYSGNDLYSFQVFAIGRGSYQIETMAFGDTIFWRDGKLVAGYEVEWQFCEAGEPVTLFPDNIEASHEVSGQQLFSKGDPSYVGFLGPYSCNPPGTETDHIICNVVLPQGIGYYDNEGNFRGMTIGIDFQLQKIDDYGNPLSEWTSFSQPSWHGATLTPQRHSVEIRPSMGRWQCRATRTDASPVNGRWLHACQWENMVSLLPGSLSYNQSIVALKVKATNVLSQSAANTFGIVYTRKLPIYDVYRKRWTRPQPTRSFAAALSSVLKASWGGALEDDRIDLDTLWGVIEPILEKKDWTFDGYFDGAYTVWSLVMEMCQAFRVVPRPVNGGVGFIYDQPGRPVRHIFTPQNIVRGSMSITYNTFTDETPDSVIWNYLDQDAGFQQREVKATLPNTETKNPVIKSFIGTVKRKQAFEMGLFAIACNRHRRIQVKFQTEGIGALIGIGDVCAINHPYYTNLNSGSVEDWQEDALMIDLGRTVETDPKKFYFLSFNMADGKPWGPCRVKSFSRDMETTRATLDNIDYQTVRRQGFANPFDFFPKKDLMGMPIVWTLQESREFEGRVIIQSITHQGNYKFEITAINDSDKVDDYDYLPVPPWNYRGSDEIPNGVSRLAAPSGFKAVVTGTKEEPVIELTWLPVSGATNYEVELRQSAGYESLGNTSINHKIFSMTTEKGTIRVRATNNAGITGPFGEYEIDINKNFIASVPLVIDSYEAGTMRGSWDISDLEEDSIVLNSTISIINYKTEALIRTIQAGESNQFVYSKEMALVDGKIERQVKARLVLTIRTSDDNILETEPSEATAVDEVPRISGEFSYTVYSGAITLNSATVDGEYTGFVVARGLTPDFKLDYVEARQINELPYTWDGLQPDTDYYFRIAAKDALADLNGYYMDLLFTDVLTLHTLPEEPDETEESEDDD